MKRRHLEDAAQAALFQWRAYAVAQYPELKLMFAVPNGGKRSIITASILKRTGVRKGVPDVWLPCQREKIIDGIRCNMSGVVIEMKAPLGYVTPDQKWWLAELNKAGWLAVVCHEWTEARDIIINYLAGPK